MSKSISKYVLRSMADRLRAESIDECVKGLDQQKSLNVTTAAILAERSATKRMVSNEIYAILDGEVK